MVSAPSLAVVPAMPMLFCMTEIALTTLPNDMDEPSTVTPSSFCTSVIFDASAMSRCISVCVPPYPSLRLSSMV